MGTEANCILRLIQERSGMVQVRDGVWAVFLKEHSHF